MHLIVNYTNFSKKTVFSLIFKKVVRQNWRIIFLLGDLG